MIYIWRFKLTTLKSITEQLNDLVDTHIDVLDGGAPQPQFWGTKKKLNEASNEKTA